MASALEKLITGAASGKINKDNAIERITIESRWLPPIVIERPMETTDAAPNPLLEFIAPKITIETPFAAPLVKAPWGEPGQTRWPQVRIALVGFGVLLALGVLVYAARSGEQ